MNKKIIYLIVISLIPLLLCGCTKNNTEKISNNILKLFKNENYIDKSLNNSEKKLVQEFINSEKPENKIVNLNPYFNSHNYSSEPNSNGVYQEDGNYFIKYKDINFIPSTSGSQVDTKALGTVYCNGHEIFISIEDLPILYKDTKDSNRYNYVYLGTNDNDKETDMYYQSLYDHTGLKIKYIKEKKQIKKIEIEYESYSTYVKPEKKANTNTLGKVLRIICLGVIIAGGVFIGLKKFRQEHNF